MRLDDLLTKQHKSALKALKTALKARYTNKTTVFSVKNGGEKAEFERGRLEKCSSKRTKTVRRTEKRG